MTDSFGMMDGAYFVSRTELLRWLNDLLKINYTKVEQVASGAAHCQIIDSLYPGKVPLKKVNFNAKFDYEFIKNYKILQSVFTQMGIRKHIDVNKLIKAKYQDNLEFLQWMKRYWDMNWPGHEYDPIARRRQCGINLKSDHSASSSKTPPPSSSSSSSSRPSNRGGASTPAVARRGVGHKPTRGTRGTGRRDPSGGRLSSGTGTSQKSQNSSIDNNNNNKNNNNNEGDKIEMAAELKDANAEVEELKQQLAQMKLTLDGLEKERDFYFGKLRDIEILCQTSEDKSNPFLKDVEAVLYETDEALEEELPPEGELPPEEDPSISNQ